MFACAYQLTENLHQLSDSELISLFYSLSFFGQVPTDFLSSITLLLNTIDVSSLSNSEQEKLCLAYLQHGLLNHSFVENPLSSSALEICRDSMKENSKKRQSDLQLESYTSGFFFFFFSHSQENS